MLEFTNSKGSVSLMTNTQETYEIGELAEGILDGYLILCSPANAIEFAIGEFLERPEDNPFTFNDKVVTANEMLEAVEQLVVYFENANAWRAHDYYEDDYTQINRAGELIARRPASRLKRFFNKF
jgi:hypothetical protein